MAKKIIIPIKVDTTDANKSVDKLGNSIGSTTAQADKLGDSLAKGGEKSKKSIDGISESLSSINNPLTDAISGVQGLGKAFLKLLANPIALLIAAIVTVVVSLYKAFARTEKGGNALNKGMSVLSGVMKGLLKALEPLASFIVDTLVVGFEKLGKVADSVIGLVSSGLRKLGYDEAAKGVENFAKSTGKLIDKTKQLADIEAALLVSRREQLLIEKQALLDAEKQRQIRDDISLSINERIAANTKLGEILEKQSQDELRIAGQALQAAKLRLEIDGQTTEALDGLALAELEVLDIQEKINGFQSEQLVNINALNEERKALANERREAKQKEFEENEEAKRVALEKQLAEDLAEDEREEARIQAKEDREQRLYEHFEVLRVDELNKKKAAIKYEEDLERAKTKMSIDLASQGLNAIAGLMEEGSEAAKGLAVAQVVFDTYRGIQSTFASAAANPTSILFPAQPFIQAGFAATFGFANIKKILSAKPASKSGGGGGGSASISRPPLPPTNASQNGLNNGSLFSTADINGGQNTQSQDVAGSNQVVKAIVVESDITSSQQMAASYENKAQIS